jgi:hypothetical protein
MALKLFVSADSTRIERQMMSTPSVSKNPLFGRSWELTITTNPDASGNPQQSIVVSSSAWEPEALRITFEVNVTAYKSLWFARISIYNMNAVTAQTILTQGMGVTLKAGFQNPGAGIIFQGQIYQPMWEQIDVVDFKLTLMCYTGMKETIGNFASFAGSPGSTQADLIAKMAAAAQHPITLGAIDTTALAQTKLPRARAFFGDPHAFFDDVAAANNLQSWTGFNGFNLGDLQAADATRTITYTPTTGIIGSPQQTQDGVMFRVLLDPRLQIKQPPMQVAIDNAVIRQLPRYPGSYPSILDKDGLYIPMGLLFVGDSRGEGGSWFTEIVAATSIGGKLAMLTEAGKVGLDRRSQQVSTPPKFQ